MGVCGLPVSAGGPGALLSPVSAGVSPFVSRDIDCRYQCRGCLSNVILYQMEPVALSSNFTQVEMQDNTNQEDSSLCPNFRPF